MQPTAEAFLQINSWQLIAGILSQRWVILLVTSASDYHLACHVASTWCYLVTWHRYEFTLLVLCLDVRCLGHHAGSTASTNRLQIYPTILTHITTSYRALFEVLRWISNVDGIQTLELLLIAFVFAWEWLFGLRVVGHGKALIILLILLLLDQGVAFHRHVVPLHDIGCGILLLLAQDKFLMLMLHTNGICSRVGGILLILIGGRGSILVSFNTQLHLWLLDCVGSDCFGGKLRACGSRIQGLG